MGDPRTKLDILYQETFGDIADLLTRIEKINTDSENITTVIKKFKAIEERADKKIDDINIAAKVFTKRSYIILAGAFILAILVGVMIGHFTYKESLQGLEIEHAYKNLSEKQLEFELQHEKMMLANREGVIFYDDGISIPTKNPDTETVEGHAIYRYPKNNHSPLTKK
jgi:hypothetical protein